MSDFWSPIVRSIRRISVIFAVALSISPSARSLLYSVSSATSLTSVASIVSVVLATTWPFWYCASWAVSESRSARPLSIISLWRARGMRVSFFLPSFSSLASGLSSFSSSSPSSSSSFIGSVTGSSKSTPSSPTVSPRSSAAPPPSSSSANMKKGASRYFSNFEWFMFRLPWWIR